MSGDELTPHRLSEADLAALDDLERRVVEVDGGRLKLEKAGLRDGGAEGVLSYDGDRLIGFAGIYVFGSRPEVAGAVDPSYRRRGVGSALLDSALRATSPESVLLVVPAGSAAGEGFARARGGTHDHAEHALVLTDPPEAPKDPRTEVRVARPDDAELVAKVLSAAFGNAVGSLSEEALVIEHDGVPVGTLRLTRDGDSVGIYGFAVTPERQGQGIGRDVLRLICRQELAAGAKRVALEVAVDNPHALRLYTSTGFVPIAGEDYWSMPA